MGESKSMMMRQMTIVTLTVLLVVLAGADSSAAGEPTNGKATWPQWRGPNRDGIDPNSPTLLDMWPEKGPKQLWKAAEKIPNGRDGGSGSPVIAGGKVFLYVHRQLPPKKVVLSTEDLKKWGWVEGVPKDLSDKLVKARKEYTVGSRGRTPKVPPIDTFIKEFMAKLEPAQAEKFKGHIEHRLKNRGTLHWSTLDTLSKLRDKEFRDFAEFKRNVKGPTHGLFSAHGADRKKFEDYYMGRWYVWKDIIYCWSADSGKLIWKFEQLGDNPTPNNYRYASSCTPAIANGKCYFGGSKAFYCIDTKDGKIVWQTATEAFNSSPLVDNGVVYAYVGKFKAMNAADGKVLWEAELKHGGRGHNSSPGIWRHEGKRYILAVDGREIACLDAASGKKLWATFFSKGSNDSSPVIAGNTLVMRGYSGMRAFELSPKAGKVLKWERGGSIGDRGASPLFYKDHVYVTGSMYGAKSICCVNLKTGKRVWSQSFPKLESTSPILADGKIIATVNHPADAKAKRKRRVTVMFKANPAKYEQLGILPDIVSSFASPAIAGGKLYLRLADGMACYDLRK